MGESVEGLGGTAFVIGALIAFCANCCSNASWTASTDGGAGGIVFVGICSEVGIVADAACVRRANSAACVSGTGAVELETLEAVGKACSASITFSGSFTNFVKRDIIGDGNVFPFTHISSIFRDFSFDSSVPVNIIS